MSYTNIKKVNRNHGNDLTGRALRFIDETCTDLRFDTIITEKEKTEGLKGTSISENQIPYNMQMDINRLCLSNTVKRFLKSGKKEDAFDVYYCYLEMFVGDYEKTRRMIELLSEFEANGSGLLMKHRDHYVHSVYVFLIGLAIYESNLVFKDEYKKFYKLTDDKKSAYHFLEFWGLTSLFHDIGYPFELPFEQVASYFEVHGDKRNERPYIAYNGLDSFIHINKNTSKKIAALYDNDENHIFDNTDEMFARLLSDKLSKTYAINYNQMLMVMNDKPIKPNKFGHFMDHAYFSSLLLFKKLFEELNADIKIETLDALTAILMHNSLYKFSIAYYKNKTLNTPFKCELHPLAYMLMLCDELQCYDRTAYGRNSKLELHPMCCNFDFSNNEIKVEYLYDKEEIIKIKKFEKDYNLWKGKYDSLKDDTEKQEWRKKEPKLKAYASMHKLDENNKNEFQVDIEKIVDLTKIHLSVTKDLVEKDYKNKNNHLSDSNFINLYNFAVVLNGQWGALDDWKKETENQNIEEFIYDKSRLEKFMKDFKNLSLEYKLSNINQAKFFAEYLDAIGCFYTNRQVSNDIVDKFTENELKVIGPMEHKRWLKEHYEMGWTYGELDKSLDKKEQKNQRENKRIHPDMIPDFDYSKDELNDDIVNKNYKRLSKEEQDKDTRPMECMLCMLKMFDGLRIYRYK